MLSFNPGMWFNPEKYQLEVCELVALLRRRAVPWAQAADAVRRVGFALRGTWTLQTLSLS